MQERYVRFYFGRYTGIRRFVLKAFSTKRYARKPLQCLGIRIAAQDLCYPYASELQCLGNAPLRDRDSNEALTAVRNEVLTQLQLQPAAPDSDASFTNEVRTAVRNEVRMCMPAALLGTQLQLQPAAPAAAAQPRPAAASAQTCRPPPQLRKGATPAPEVGTNRSLFVAVLPRACMRKLASFGPTRLSHNREDPV
jgi:hypothetical protein